MEISDKSNKEEMLQNKDRLEQSKSDITQKQYAGHGSTQIQAASIIINQGITEERVRNIFTEMVPQVLEKYTEEAHGIANSRIQQLENYLISRLVEIDDAISAFSDPAFQIQLKQAQLSAAATERSDDYALLSELLICQIHNKEERMKRAAISKAIEIVDDIDNAALHGLTLVYVIKSFHLKSTAFMKELSDLNDLLTRMLEIDPPQGLEWIDHLDTLGAVRVTEIYSEKKYQKTRWFHEKLLSTYYYPGLKIGSKEYQEASVLLERINLSVDYLVPNELLIGYVRLPILSRECIDDLSISINNTPRQITIAEKEVLKHIWDMGSSSNNTLSDTIYKEYTRISNSFESIVKVNKWWSSIPALFDITRAGKVLAYTNAKRYNPDLPEFQ